MTIVDITYRCQARGAPVRQRPRDGRAARRRLDDGNRAFATLFDGLADRNVAAQRIVPIDPRDLGMLQAAKSRPPQAPFAAVLGCSDARVPIELIFNEGPNDLFVVRVAGNGLGGEVIGSLRYAVEHLGASLKLVVVLGHSGCGAVSEAVDIFLDPARYLAHATGHMLRNILDRLLIVVHASARRLLEVFGPQVVRRRGYRDALIETSVATNAALAAHTVQHELGGRDAHGLRVAYGVYLLENRRVWSPRGGGAARIGLADPPRDPAAFVEFGNVVARSDRIASLLASK